MAVQARRDGASWWPIAAIVLIGLAVTGIAFQAAQTAEEDRIEQELQLGVDWRSKDLERKVEAALETFVTTSVFVLTQDVLDEGEFRRFTTRAFRAGQPIAAVDWVPRVPHERRAEFEREASLGRASAFRILERAADGRTVPAADRDEYFPVWVQTRYEGMGNAEGFDLASEPVRAEAMALARDTGRPRATLGTQGLSGVGQTYLAFWPIYEGGVDPQTVEQRRARLTGFVLGVYRVASVLAAAIVDTPEIQSQINFYLGDDRVADWERTSPLVATYSPAIRGFLPAPRSDPPAAVAHRFVRSFDIVGQRWGIEFLFTPGSPDARRSIAPYAVLLAGLVLTGALAVYVMRERRQRFTIEAIVARRTADLTLARADAEAARARMADWASASTDWFWESDAEHRWTYVSDGFEKATGLEPQGSLGQLRFDCRPPPDPTDEKWVAHLADQTARLPFRDVVTSVDHPRGRRYMSVSGRPMVDGAGRFVGYRGTSRDITGQVEAERRLASQAEIFATLIENLPIGVSLVGGNLRLMAFNHHFLELFDLTPDIVRVGDTLAKVIRYLAVRGEYGPGDVEKQVRAMLESAAAPRPQQFEHTRPDGQIVDVRRVPLPGGGFVTTYADVTQTRNAARQMAQAQKAEAVGQLSGGIAHEFNNLLGVIIGNLDMLAETIAGNAEATEMNAAALDAALRGSALVARLLAFSRIQPLQPTQLQLGDVIRELEPFLARSLGENIIVTLAPSDDLWPVTADRAQLENAIVAVALNARDAMPRGGTVTISCTNASIDTAGGAARDLPKGDYVRVSVRDTGTGIAPEVLPRVFEPFFTTKQADQGSGLGLSMVQGYARQSGGTATIYSEPGHGTEVRLYLPRTPQPAATATAPGGPQEPQPGDPLRILVVEDKDDVRQMAVRLIEGLGYRAVAVESAAAACGVLDTQAAPDLLFTDIMMPGEMNGVDLAVAVRRRFPAMPIVFTSGFSNPETTHAEVAALGGSIISKPYRRAELAECLTAALSSRKNAA